MVPIRKASLSMSTKRVRTNPTMPTTIGRTVLTNRGTTARPENFYWANLSMTLMHMSLVMLGPISPPITMPMPNGPFQAHQFMFNRAIIPCKK